MAIKRSDNKLVIEKAVTADTDIISEVHIDFRNKLADVVVSHGNAIGDDFEFISESRFTISNSKSGSGIINETLTLDNNDSITLLSIPETVGIKIKHGDDYLFMGSDWTINGNVITFLIIKKDEVVDVSYKGFIDGTVNFDDLNIESENNEFLFDLIERSIVLKAIEMGKINGIIE